MKRSATTRLLLLGLVVVTMGLVYKIVRFDPEPGASLVLDDLSVDQLHRSAFSIEREPVEVVIRATGSLQSGSLMAAYPWIVRRDDREVVWTLDPKTGERGSGQLVSVEDRIWLEPGEYEVYYTSFGDPHQPVAEPEGFFDNVSALVDNDFQRWQNESGNWHMSLRLEPDEKRGLFRNLRIENQLPEGPQIIWRVSAVGPNKGGEYLFETSRSVRVSIRSVSSVGPDGVGGGWIENIETGEQVWGVRSASTTHAGGDLRNRSFSQVVTLPVGRFRAAYRAGRDHAFGHWDGNPPYDPLAWGLSMAVVDPRDIRAISDFDPYESLPRVASLTGIGDNQNVSYSFATEDPLRVLVYALGEGEGSSMYDYAWIVDEKHRKEVWQMKMSATKHAGGAAKNRRTEAVLDLDPGKYTVHYKSDGSHSFEYWNDDAPSNPENWGVTVFSLDAGYIPDNTPVAFGDLPEPRDGFKTMGDGPLVSLIELGDDVRITDRFVLDEQSDVQIFAVGEMTRDGRFDYGWIIEELTGRVVWEMTRRNSDRAGGTSKNRVVDVVISLPSGEYAVHFQTDDSHSFPDFRYGGAPNKPSAWGITVQRVAEIE